MWTYINPASNTQGRWQVASLMTVNNLQKASEHAQKLQDWVRQYVADREALPVNPYGHWNESVIDKDPILIQEIHAYLQSIGKFVHAMDLIKFIDTAEMRERMHLKKPINLATAQQWMKKLDYCWSHTPKGQYVDGHEREDVVIYR